MSDAGRIYAKGKCPVCKGPFKVVDEKDMLCPIHLTRPKRFYIQIQGRNIFSDPDRIPFSDYGHTRHYLEDMRVEIRRKTFDLSRYVAQKLKPFEFTNWSEEWLKKKKKEVELGRKSPSYLKALKVYVGRYQDFFGDEDIRDITAKRVDDFYLTLKDSPKYVKNLMDGFHKLLKDAKKFKAIYEVPDFPEYSDIPEAELKRIEIDEQDQIINSIPDQMDRTFILLTAREMIRPSETRALWWTDLDLKHGRMVVRRHFSLNTIRPATKARQIKNLPLGYDVVQTLDSLPRHISSPFVFWKGKEGKPFSESWARKLWKRAAQTLGVDVSLYQGTRHSSATEAVNRVGVDAVQEFLHHTSREMTKRYAKVNPESLRRVIDRTSNH